MGFDMDIRWQSSEAWYIAPEGYAIDEAVDSEGYQATSFEEQYAYTVDDRIVGFRWHFNNGIIRDALVPEEGNSYEWSHYPYGWSETGGLIGYPATKYTNSGSFTVWVYAPIHLATIPPVEPPPEEPPVEPPVEPPEQPPEEPPATEGNKIIPVIITAGAIAAGVYLLYRSF